MAHYYGTIDDADDYFAERGNATWAAASDHDKGPALMRASSYIDARYRNRLGNGVWYSLFAGTKTGGRAQELEWPRTDAQDYTGEEIPDDEIPREVKHATYEAAVRELETPGLLLPDYTSSELVKREKVGPVEVEYSVSESMPGQWPPNLPQIPAIDGIIAPLLVPAYIGPAILAV